MPKFSYVVKDKEGKAYKNVVDAVGQKALVEKLQQQGYFIVNIKEISITPSKRYSAETTRWKKKFGHKRVKLEDLLTFSRQLATMLESGINLTRSLDVILSQVESEQLHEILSKVKKDVEQGGSLSSSLARHPKVFNQFWTSLVEIGEASGTLPFVLTKLAFYLEQEAAFRTTVVSGLIYPAILFLVSTGAIFFFALVVGPKFESIFKSMGVKLPLMTQILLTTFKFIKEHLLWIIGSFGILIFAFVQALKTYRGRLLWESFLFRLPTVGDVYRQIIIERFTSQMSILIDSGVPILYALDIAERLVDNHTCALVIGNVKEGVREGSFITTPMEKSGFFPPMCIQMIMVGEETGELSKMLKQIATYYQSNVETFMKRFSTIIEPFMLLFMGAVIGIIVVAMFLPMFNIAQLGGAGGG